MLMREADGRSEQDARRRILETPCERPADVAAETLAAIAEDLDRRLTRAAGLRGVVSAHLQALARQEAIYARIVEHRSGLSQEALDGLQRIDRMVSAHLDRALASGCAGCDVRVSPRFAFQVWTALVHHRLMVAGARAPQPVFALARRREALVRNYLALVRSRPPRGRRVPDGRTGPDRWPPSPSPAGKAW
jgi:hypothetical protein